jgi:NADH:ubiquinone oxidoreductase subunit F (NADH-binding)/Pyruvate/2-oxoacid:ferredoxin oxidoreductase delta subunit
MTVKKDIEFLVSEVTLNFAREYDTTAREKIELVCRQKLTKPVIYLGTGTCGIAAGASETLEAVKEYLQLNQLDAEIVEVGCIGLCSAEPLMDFQTPGKSRVSFQKVTPAAVPIILDECFHAQLSGFHVLGQIHNNSHETWDNVAIIQELPFFKKQHRILLYECGEINPDSITEYLAREGYQSFAKTILNYTPEEVCDMIEKSGLRGRGGGGYNTGKKWKSVRSVGSDQKYLVCNADESDPGAYMDRALIEGNPHRIVEGIAIAAYAIGATKAFIYIRSEYALAVKRLKKAIEQAKEAGFLGENIQNSGFRLQIFLREGPGAFVCGEETALLKSLEGRRGMPRSKPPYPVDKGLFGKPTAISNVETLANIPLILSNGPQWFANIGTKDSTGTKLFALTGDNINTGLIEVPFGITIEEIIFDIGGGLKDEKKLKAVQIGGPSGSLIPERHIDITIDYKTFEEQNLIMGSGGFIVMDQGTCIVDIVKYFIHFLQDESCGKCIPCREGTNRMYEILNAITRRPGDNESHQPLLRFKGVLQLENLAEVIKETSLCGLGKTAPNPVLSALKWFREEFEEHLYERKCRANVCRDIRTYIISAERCTGCTICMKKCPEDAITGSVREVHTIIQNKCISCGICYDSCRFSAIDIL